MHFSNKINSNDAIEAFQNLYKNGKKNCLEFGTQLV